MSFSLYTKSIFFLFFTMLSLPSLALPDDGRLNFTRLISEVKANKDSNPKKSLELLAILENNFAHYSSNEQMNFYAVQSDLYSDLAQHQLSKESAEKGLALAQGLSSPSVLISELSYTLGFALESLGDFEGASRNYTSGLEVAKSLNDEKQIANGLINLGAIYYLTERPEKALIVLQEALAIANRLNDTELKGFVNSELGILHGMLADYEKSIYYYQASYEYYSEIGQSIDAISNLRNMGTSYRSNEQYDEAIQVYKRITDNAENIANIEVLYSAYIGLAWSYVKKEDSDPETSYHYLMIAEEYMKDIQQHIMPLLFAIEKAYILDAMQKFDEALNALHEAETLLVSVKNQISPFTRLNIINLKGAIYNDLGMFEKAYSELSTYIIGYNELRESENIDALAGLRAKYESEQADLQKQILEKQQALEKLALTEAQKKSEDKQKYFLIIAIIALLFAWLSYHLYLGQQKLLKASRSDPLTGIANRRRLTELGEKYLTKAMKQNTDFSILTIDCDHFKSINDKYGHAVGDKVLKKLAIVGDSSLHDLDVIGRVGGEEFIALLPNSSFDEAKKTAEKFRKAVRSETYELAGDNPLTVSIGVATYDNTAHDDFDALLKNADYQMYKAKKQGRDQVCA